MKVILEKCLDQGHIKNHQFKISVEGSSDKKKFAKFLVEAPFWWGP